MAITCSDVAQYGEATFEDARRMLGMIKAAGGVVTTDEYYGIVEAAAWLVAVSGLMVW